MTERSKSKSKSKGGDRSGSTRSIIPFKGSNEDSLSSKRQPDPGRFTQFEEVGPEMEVRDMLPFCDIVAVILVCPRHNKVALAEVDSMKQGLWFPVSPVNIPLGHSYEFSIRLLLRKVLMAGPRNDPFKNPILVHHLRIQTVNLNYVTRMLYYTELSIPNQSQEVDCCMDSPILRWFTFEQVPTLNEMWGPEPAEYSHSLEARGAPNFPMQNPTEMTTSKMLDFMKESESCQEVLKSCGCSEPVLLQLYSEFVQHCFPSQSMNLFAFFNYLERSKLNLGDHSQLPFLFRAFSINLLECIDVNEFVLGLAALDKAATHGGTVGRFRVHYIYRYYHLPAPGTNILQFNIQKFTRDWLFYKQSNVDPTEEELNQTMEWLYSIMRIEPNQPVPRENFSRAIGSLQIRGTSSMFRAEESPINHIKTNLMYDSEMQPLGSCARCRAKSYSISAHSVKMLGDRSIVTPLKNLYQFRTLTDAPHLLRARRKHSNLLFKENPFNTLLDNIREMGKAIRNVNEYDNLWHKKKAKLYKQYIQLCNAARPMFAKLPRVLKLNSPAYVLGDIHGNLIDLMAFDKMLWPSGPSCMATNFLFLGDYVDRGNYSIECAAFLMSLKMLAPERIHLLRGNHEIRDIQNDFTFKKECIAKFGSQQGEILCERFNEVFDYFPICAVIDEKIYCAHGGIPATNLRLDQIKLLIPSPLRLPDQCLVAWEILWNDPFPSDNLYDPVHEGYHDLRPNTPAPDGFSFNTKRATAFFFSEEAVRRFLSINGLSHIIRAHEVKNPGYEFHFGGLVTTVFSCSRYCNLPNEAACMLVGLDGKIRPIKLDTASYFNST